MQKKPGSDDKAQQHGDMNKKPGQQGYEKQQQQGGYQPQQGGKLHEGRKSEESSPPGSKPYQSGE